MGYSNSVKIHKQLSWNEKFDTDIKGIFDMSKDILQEGSSEDGPPVMERTRIGSFNLRFNGKGEERCEDFWINGARTEKTYIKTSRGDYDKPMQMIMLALVYHYGDKVTIDSDGFSDSVTAEKIYDEKRNFRVGDKVLNADQGWNESINEFNIWKKDANFALICTRLKGHDNMYYSAKLKRLK